MSLGNILCAKAFSFAGRRQKCFMMDENAVDLSNILQVCERWHHCIHSRRLFSVDKGIQFSFASKISMPRQTIYRY